MKNKNTLTELNRKVIIIETPIHQNYTKQTLAQEEKMIIEIIKRIMSEKKTTLTSVRNQD